MNVEVSRGKAWKHPGDRGMHGRVLRLTFIHPELSCMKSLGLPAQKDDKYGFFCIRSTKKKKKKEKFLDVYYVLCCIIYGGG